jgi:hypothetical protein
MARFCKLSDSLWAAIFGILEAKSAADKVLDLIGFLVHSTLELSKHTIARRTSLLGGDLGILLWSLAWDRLVKSMFGRSVVNWYHL